MQASRSAVLASLVTSTSLTDVRRFRDATAIAGEGDSTVVAARCTSATVTRPSGPVPAILSRLSPRLLARRRTRGEWT